MKPPRTCQSTWPGLPAPPSGKPVPPQSALACPTTNSLPSDLVLPNADGFQSPGIPDLTHIASFSTADRSTESLFDGVERVIYQPAEVPTEPMAMPEGESTAALEKGGGYLPSLAGATSDGPAAAMASDSPSLAHWWRAFCAGEIVSQDSLHRPPSAVLRAWGERARSAQSCVQFFVRRPSESDRLGFQNK